MDIGKPYPDSPDEGVITVNAELVPLASPDFESGPPRQESIELARVVDRAIRESKMIDLGKLCIKEKEHIWMIFVDIDVINDDGNLIDAACLAAVGALLNTRIPKLEMDGETPVVNRDEKSANKLPLTGIAITTTFVKIAGQLMADPNLAEFKALDARLSIGTLKGKLCSMQKGGTYGFGIDEIDKMVDLAEKKGDELRTLLEKHIL
jgi:exosome complex component RRP42